MKKTARKNKKLRKDLVTIDELSYFFRMRKCLLERLVMLDVIEPFSTEPEYCFSLDLIPRMEKIIRLHHELGVGWNSMALVLHLLDRIEKLEKSNAVY